MIYSMTAFTRNEIQNTTFTGTWEIRSINQRYLDIHIYLPENFKNLETKIRKSILNTDHIIRGRLECKLYINTNYENIQNTIILNTKLIKTLIRTIKKIHNKKIVNKIDPIKILSWPGVIISNKDNDDQKLYPIILQTFHETLNKILTIRKNEGTAIQKILEDKLSNINIAINNIKEEIPITILHQKQNMLKKINELNIQNVDNKRLEEEILIYTQKIDISEEIDRLEIHIKNITNIITSKQAIGRKLDFIAQELYKETNTISAKSTNIKIIQLSIEIKMLVEQIREQIQNIQ